MKRKTVHLFPFHKCSIIFHFLVLKHNNFHTISSYLWQCSFQYLHSSFFFSVFLWRFFTPVYSASLKLLLLSLYIIAWENDSTIIYTLKQTKVIKPEPNMNMEKITVLSMHIRERRFIWESNQICNDNFIYSNRIQNHLFSIPRRKFP